MAKDPLTAALNIGNSIIERIWPDPAQRDAAKLELFKLQQSGELAVLTGQMEINKVEASNPSVFVSGWRPASGWIANAGLAYTFVLQPLASWLSRIKGWPEPPALDIEVLMALLTGMLGIGGLRSFDKVKGVASK